MQITMSIGAVERDTGLSKDALRIWERRYGFPTPLRDAGGERAYLQEDVEKLRVLKRLLDQGYRPGKIIHHDIRALQQLILQSVSAGRPPGTHDVDDALLNEYLLLCKTHQTETLRVNLSHALSRMGLERFLMTLLAPLNRLVGESWASGSLQVFEEHLYTESVQVVMRTAISSLRIATGRQWAEPKVLMTTLPHEQHGLGLLMAEAMFTQEGARCISLGVQTPIDDIVRAAVSQQADIVALSVSTAMSPKEVRDGLESLRERLPDEMELWVGGSSSALSRLPSSIRIMTDLSGIGAALAVWRSARVMA